MTNFSINVTLIVKRVKPDTYGWKIIRKMYLVLDLVIRVSKNIEILVNTWGYPPLLASFSINVTLIVKRLLPDAHGIKIIRNMYVF